MMASLKGKVAIVTGGTRGIGRGIATELARRVRTFGGEAAAVQADCRSLTAPTLIVDTARKAFDNNDGIDIIINNAGISEEYYLEDIGYDHFDRVMQTNVRFPIFLVKECLPYLRKGGRIVNMSSVCAREAWKMHTVYGASKACLENITKTWAVELGHKYNVTVNCVNPGPVGTEMWHSMPPESKEECQQYVNQTPAAPRVAAVDDIAQIVAFLCEDAARWITGSTTCANGGAVMV
ncbi:hypothetical protein LCI18_014035 [Fusarium solani-melongenae]|uniref:Uncharacterized protein n=1 Tax=Fusarium solani subsp. cucurbitae TaxID=2747967 RepID=A0ACD3ZPF0_FUSSC|nr:hypothetical protein LCI18_014035 [Fusarium solani-melongenae]